MLIKVLAIIYFLFALGCCVWLLFRQLCHPAQERHPALWVAIVLDVLAMISIVNWSLSYLVFEITPFVYAMLSCYDMVGMLLLPILGDVLIRHKMVWPKFIFSELVALTVPVAYILTEDMNIIYYALFLYMVYFIGMIVWQMNEVRQYDKHLRDELSDLTGISRSWLIYLQVLFILLGLTWLSSFIEDLGWGNMNYVLYAIFMMIDLFLITYFLSDVKMTKVELNISVEEELPFKRIMERNAEWDAKLSELMTKEQVWKMPEIGVEEVAQMMGTNRTYLYRYLREVLGTTFYDLVNRFRLEYAVSLMNKSDQKLSLEQISKSSGFKSVRSFRTVFQEKYGCTPTEYMANASQSD